MSPNKEEERSRTKLAKLVAAFDKDLSEDAVEAILQTDGDINYMIPCSEFLDSLNYRLQPGTILHQLKRLKESSIPKIMKLLLKYGVDITKTNHKGHTVLHAELNHRKYSDNWQYASNFNHPIVESILSAHVDQSIRQNPCDDNNISHFHLACMTGLTRTVEFFLDAGVDVNQAINLTSPIFPGCTPLHLAVTGGRLETTKTLLQYGANLRSEHARGLVSLLVKRNLSIMNWEVAGSNRNLIEEYEINQKMLRLLLANVNINNNSSQIALDEHNFTNFHAACACDNTFLVDGLLVHVEDVNQTVSSHSTLWPGYTPLHFAAHFNVNLVKLLLSNGGDLVSKDARGVTPFDIILQRHRVDDVHALLSAHSSWKNIMMSDKRTNLLDLFEAMKNEDKFRTFLNSHQDANNLVVDEKSPLWPGYSVLHFAVIFSERASSKFHEITRSSRNDDSLVKDTFLNTWLLDECLDRGITQNTTSIIHLAFYSQKQNCVKHALEHVKAVDLVDDNGLSLLHIACTTNARKLVERTGTNVNLPMGPSIKLKCETFHPGTDAPLTRFFVVAGSTPLHVAVTAHNVETAKVLLRRGADVNATNVDGWSPLHVLALMPSGVSVGKAVLTFTAKLREQVVEGVGLSHLHVACHVDSLRGVKKLIKLGSDVNAVVRFDSTPITENYVGCRNALDLLRQTDYTGFTPLHFAVKCGSVKVATVLLEAGADVLAKNAKGVSILHEVLAGEERNEQLIDLFVEHLQDDKNLQNRLEEDSGVTLLHVLAFRMNVKKVRKVDVNAKVKDDSLMWPGCTALHTWAYGLKGRDLADLKVTNTLTLLLKAGADVTMMNKMLDTSLHLFDRSFATIDEEIILSMGRLLLSRQRNFKVNPTNASGVSHFHIAVRMRQVAIVEEFLKRGADVNQRIDVLSNDKPGFTALHLLTTGESTFLKELPATEQTIELLLRHGADVRARDVLDNLPLHALVKDEILRKKLVDMIIC